MLTRKYLPQHSSEILGQNKAITTLKNGILNNKSLLIYGPTGVGKTCSVHALGKELLYEVIEINTSDFRNKNKIESVLGQAVKQQSLFHKSKIILIDDIDGLSGRKDRGGVQAIQALIKTSKFPIVITSNDPWDSKFNSLRRQCHMIEFPAIDHHIINQHLKHICIKENIEHQDKILKTIARQSDGDMRSAISDMENLTILQDGLKDSEELGLRNKKEEISNSLRLIFKSFNPNIVIKAFDNVDNDIRNNFMWIDENLPKEYNVADLAKAYDYLSKADRFYGRIMKWQHWRFLVYMNTLMTAGVAISKSEKKNGFVEYKRSGRILKLWQAKMKYAKKKSIAEKVAKKVHVSKKIAYRDIMPYLKFIIRNNPKVTEELELTNEEIDWLSS